MENPEPGSAAHGFLHSLVALRTSDVLEDCLGCCICHENYLIGPSAVDKPVQLPCGHHFGFECIRRWLKSSNQCPMCRSKLFERDQKLEANRLQESIDLLSRLVSDTTSLASIMDDARRQTERRIAHSQRIAGDQAMEYNTRNRYNGFATSRTPRENRPEPTARQVLKEFQVLVFVDLYTTQELSYNRWKHLERTIERVRRRLMTCREAMNTLWDSDGPELEALLNPVLRPLVEEFLKKMVQVEEEGMSMEC